VWGAFPSLLNTRIHGLCCAPTVPPQPTCPHQNPLAHRTAKQDKGFPPSHFPLHIPRRYRAREKKHPGDENQLKKKRQEAIQQAIASELFRHAGPWQTRRLPPGQGLPELPLPIWQRRGARARTGRPKFQTKVRGVQFTHPAHHAERKERSNQPRRFRPAKI